MDDRLYAELWVSLASLLRSYTAAHGLNGDRQATVELGEERITVRHGDRWLDLKRDGATVTWQREDGRSGMLELTEAGRLRLVNHVGNDPWSPSARDHHPTNEDLFVGAPDQGHPAVEATPARLGHFEEEEMDLAAEAWARELMQ